MRHPKITDSMKQNKIFKRYSGYYGVVFGNVPVLRLLSIGHLRYAHFCLIPKITNNVSKSFFQW